MDKKFLLKYSFNNGDRESEISKFISFKKFEYLVENLKREEVRDKKLFCVWFKFKGFSTLYHSNCLIFKSENYGRSSMVDFLTSLQKAFERQDLSCVKISLHFDKFSMSFTKSLGEECKLIGEYERVVEEQSDGKR